MSSSNFYWSFSLAFSGCQKIIPAILARTTPPSITKAGLPVNVIYSLDLGIILPAFALSAYWLWKRRAWGYAFTSVLLTKIVTLGGAVLAMIVYLIQSGNPVPYPQIIIFSVLTILGLWLLVRFLQSIDSETEGASIVSTSGPIDDTEVQ